jgi:hypothetical protein
MIVSAHRSTHAAEISSATIELQEYRSQAQRLISRNCHAIDASVCVRIADEITGAVLLIKSRKTTMNGQGTNTGLHSWCGFYIIE